MLPRALLGMIVFGFVISASAIQKDIQLNVSDIVVDQPKGKNAFVAKAFSTIEVKGFENNKVLGEPSLPIKTWLLNGEPQHIIVDVIKTDTTVIPQIRPMPVQKQPCRCALDENLQFQFNQDSYQQQPDQQKDYELKYLGKYKGQPITQLTVKLAHYDAHSNEVILNTGVSVKFNVPEFELQSENLKNILIVVPENFATGIDDFVDWKKSSGYNVFVQTILAPNSTTAAVSQTIMQAYQNAQADFVIIVGDEKSIPMFYVDTDGASRTPSDLKYYLMDGSDDNIPDVYASRIVAKTAEQARLKLAKAIEFEKRSYLLQNGLKTMIGIASNEGDSPSDDEYVTHVENQFKAAKGFSAKHFYQDDPNSNPTQLNQALSEGAVWLTYMGHGTGQAWPSMYKPYKVTDMNKVQNKNAVKPIVIDVACQNGRLVDGQFGSTLTNVFGLNDNDAFGAAAYYGGSVNISWHPPAVMAVGIAEQHARKNYKHLAQALLAGQLYLAGHWNQTTEIIDNLEWFHLQGDPSMNIQF